MAVPDSHKNYGAESVGDLFYFGSPPQVVSEADNVYYVSSPRRESEKAAPVSVSACTFQAVAGAFFVLPGV